MFTLCTYVYSELYLEATPNAPLGPHLSYVVFLELAMGLVFFYTTFFGIPWVQKKQSNLLILSAVLLALLLVFAYPATHFGLLQVLSSIIPHILLVFLAVVFRNSFRIA
jgi:hypothetical protein